MPPPLHPRSAFTTSLFTTTLALSFAVVGLPHLLPCPVDSRQYAEGKMNGLDGDLQRQRQRKRQKVGKTELPTQREHQSTILPKSVVDTSIARDERRPDSQQDTPMKRTRECPVPKPRGIVGQILGFKREVSEEAVKPTVKIKTETASKQVDPNANEEN